MTMRLIVEKALVRANRKIPKEYRPTEDEPFMSNRQRAYFRGKLLVWRDEILRSTKETVQHLQEESVQHPDLADQASTETERAVELRARDRQRKLNCQDRRGIDASGRWHLRLLRRDRRADQFDATRSASGRDLERRSPGTPRAARMLL
jgi:hypothetical protein